MIKLTAMNYKTKDRLEAVYNSIKDYFYQKVTRPIKKWKRRKEFEKKRVLITQAKGELVEQFDRLMVSILNEALSEYRENKTQNHYTIQTSHDIKTAFENVLTDYVNSTK